jgi:hypothetical protein
LVTSSGSLPIATEAISFFIEALQNLNLPLKPISNTPETAMKALL